MHVYFTVSTAAIAAIDILERDGPRLMSTLHTNAQRFRKAASSIPGLTVIGREESSISPIIHLQLTPVPAKESWAQGDLYLQQVVEECMDSHAVLLNVSKYSSLEHSRSPPSIRVALSAAHSEKDIDKAVAALKAVCKGRKFSS